MNTININVFENISTRGRVAWAICCLENLLQHFNDYNEVWELFLSKIWSYTSTPNKTMPYEYGGIVLALEEWDLIMEKFSPSRIKKTSNYIEVKESFAMWSRMGSEINWIPTEEEFLLLQNGFAETRVVLCEVCELIHYLGIEFMWGASEIPIVEHTELNRLIEIMKECQVEIPSAEPFMQYAFDVENLHLNNNPRATLIEERYRYGLPFDGIQYSKFIKKNN